MSTIAVDRLSEHAGAPTGAAPQAGRLHALDAVRGGALLLGVFLHGAVPWIQNFPPGMWVWTEPPSTAIGLTFFVIHMFRMSLFFMLAGFFGRMLLERQGTSGFVRNRRTRILVPLVAGLPIVLVSIGLFALAGAAVGGVEMPTFETPEAAPAGSFPWAHLWFLYYLLIFYVLALAVRTGVGAIDRAGRIAAGADAVVRFLFSGVWGLLVVALPLAAFFYNLDGWPSWTGMPAPLVFLPHLPSVICYGTPFAVGWLVHRQTDRLLALEQRWPAFLTMAIVLTVVCLAIGGTAPRWVAYLDGRDLMVYAIAYMTAAWAWIFGLIGAAIKFLSAPSPARRYLADASYWIYLMHLSVLAFFHLALGPLSWHWSIKYPLQVALTCAVLLISYRYLVRATFIGAILNGRRYRVVHTQGDF